MMPSHNQEFQGKAVLITGAGRGIGKRLAIGFGASGAHVGLLARSKPELDLTKLEIEHAGGTALTLRADVRDAESVAAAAERMRAHFGAIHVLVCAAGVQGPVGPFLESAQGRGARLQSDEELPVAPREAGSVVREYARSTAADWRETVETNLLGVVNAVAAVLAEMAGRRAGKVVVLSGSGGAKPRPNFSAYAASKAAVARFVETVAEELREHNVQVNCMSPGGAYTHMTDEILRAGEKAGWKEAEEAARLRVTGGIPAEKQLALAMFLASERSNHVSGKLVHVSDEWKRLESSNVHPEMFTLRRVLKV